MKDKTNSYPMIPFILKFEKMQNCNNGLVVDRRLGLGRGA